MISCGRNVYTNNGVNYKGHTEDEMTAAGGLCRVDTIEELAAWIGCDAATLQATIDAHNANCADGTDEEFGRPIYAENYLVDTPPYYACRRAPAVHHTMGGVVVNTEQQVLNEQGGVIAGLFAAGEVTGGFHGANRVGGNAVSEALTTGRLAGASAMK